MSKSTKQYTKVQLVAMVERLERQGMEYDSSLEAARTENTQLRALNAEWAGEAQRLKVALLRATNRSTVERVERIAEKPMSVLQQASIKYCADKGATSVTPAELKAAGYL